VILVDSSVWIDYFRGSPTREADRLDALLGSEILLIGDLILTEVLQGFVADRAFNQARRMLGALEVVEIGGRDVAIRAAQNFRLLRARGITVRKTINTLIATRCIADKIPLLYSDSDFDPFIAHLGLRTALN
jgi:predicted nucleic acid-binding protein